MKIEYLIDGSSDCPLIRLFDFSETELASLCDGVHALAIGSRDEFDLTDELGAILINGDRFILTVGQRDSGLQCENSQYHWVLRSESWEQVEGLMETVTVGDHCFQWLSDVAGTSLLLSQDGTW